MENLLIHPSQKQSSSAKLSVFAQVKLQNGYLEFGYKIVARVDAAAIVWKTPERSKKELTSDDRKDELWKETCLEAFVQLPDGTYFEINFSPAGFWNVYRFDSYRVGMKKEESVRVVSNYSSMVASNAHTKEFQLTGAMDLSQAVRSPQHLRLGLTAVIETAGGERSYWSLKHTGEKPDFHDSRGHIIELRI